MKRIVLEGPGKNAMSTTLMERVLGEIRGAGDDALLLTGAGDAFSAGLDLKEIVSLDAAGMGRFLGVLEDLVEALYLHPGPTVAFVNGHAIAGGCVLALACDVRVMTAREGARIGLNEVALGLQFPPRTFAMVRDRLTKPALERVILEAALYRAEDAKGLGVVHAIGDEEGAKESLAILAGHPRETYAYAKRVLRASLAVPEDEARRFREITVPAWASPELKAKLRAVLTRR
jgi:enoyl-CoA hydratase/carnithine racemase